MSRMRTRITALAGAFTVAALAATLVATPAVTAVPAADPPRTGFEQRAGASWTTQPEEQRFLRALDAASPRVRLIEIGRTKQDRPLQLLAIGAPAPKTPARIARGSSVLFLGSQHGDEPSGREAAMQLARDLAFGTDAATRELLRSTTVLIVPSANPDGTAANTRENSDEVDINRDHLVLATAEAQAFARVIRDHRPDLVHDLHEYGPTPKVYDRQLIHLWPRNRNVDSSVHDLSVRLNRSFVGPDVRKARYSTGIYGIHYGPDGKPIAQVAGDGQERILRNTAGLRHSMGILVEANNEPTTPAERASKPALNNRRVLTQVIATRSSLRMVAARRGAIADATTAAAARATEAGASGDQPFAFGGADNMLPDPEQVDTTPPCAYRLTAGQFARAAKTLRLHGIASTANASGGRVVSLAQPARPVIPLLLDERAEYGLLAATPVECRT